MAVLKGLNMKNHLALRVIVRGFTLLLLLILFVLDIPMGKGSTILLSIIFVVSEVSLVRWRQKNSARNRA